ncbi:MAG: hypothetical protein ACOCYT_03860 [Chloroflexota bacterium]
MSLETGRLLLFGLGGGVMLSVGMWRLRRPSRLKLRAAALLAYGLGLVAVIVVVSASAPQTGNADVLEATLNNGRPTLIMLYSHFCAECVASLPGTRALDDELNTAGAALDVVLLDINTHLGRSARGMVGFNPPMTYVLYDAAGQEVLRTNRLPTAEAIRAVLGG